jgi:hypothetical protein
MRAPDDWRGPAALALAILVAGGWAVALIIVALPATDPLGSHAAGLLGTLGGVLAGILSAYLGRLGPPNDK